MCTHPDQVLAGRALTAVYMPRRHPMRTPMEERGAQVGCIGDQISWPIDRLVPGDVYVADVYGKIEHGPIIGDNLATSIYANSGNGVVYDAAIRDLDGIKQLSGFASYVRGWYPSFASPTIMLIGINCPVRIGSVTVMAGDLVLGKEDGVIFIPAHLAEKVVKTAELVAVRDKFGKQRLAEGRYTSGQIDTRWADDIERDFSHWLQTHMDELPVAKEAIQNMLKERTW